MYVCVYMYIYICVYVFVCMYAYVCMCIYICLCLTFLYLFYVYLTKQIKKGVKQSIGFDFTQGRLLQKKFFSNAPSSVSTRSRSVLRLHRDQQRDGNTVTRNRRSDDDGQQSQYRERKTHQRLTQYEHSDVGGELTQAQDEEDGDEDGPGRREGQRDAEDARPDDGDEQDRLPAEPPAPNTREQSVSHSRSSSRSSRSSSRSSRSSSRSSTSSIQTSSGTGSLEDDGHPTC